MSVGNRVRIDSRALRVLVLGSWSVFLGWMWASHQVLRYLGTRTEWVVPAGAITLAVTTVGYLRLVPPNHHSARPRANEVVGAVALLLPIAFAVTMAGSSLGAFSASRTLASRGVDVSALAAQQAARTGPVTFLQMNMDAKELEGRTNGRARLGSAVTLVGFVAKTPVQGSHTFTLARYYVGCCVADAIPIGAQVIAPDQSPTIHKDEWLRATGVLAPRGKHKVKLQATRLTPVREPRDPYLSFVSG